MERKIPYVYLIVVLLTGCLIRFQWSWPDLGLYNTRYLIHAHSHLALLGWLYPILMDAAYRFLGHDTDRIHHQPIFRFLFHTLVVLMTVAFLLQGYGAASIALSSLIMAFMVVSGIRFLHLTWLDQHPRLNVFRAAVIWMLISLVGPLALAGGAFMGPGWISGWVGFYLHLQFSGWVTLAVLGWMSDSQKGLIWLNVGILFLLEPYFRTDTTPLWIQWMGFAGGLATLIGTFIWLQQQSTWQLTHWAFGLKGVLQASASIPILGQTFLGTHFLAIAFAHLILLGFATAWMIRTPSRVYLIGTWLMIAFLFIIGLSQWIGIPIHLPIQPILLTTGLMVAIGALPNLYQQLITTKTIPI